MHRWRKKWHKLVRSTILICVTAIALILYGYGALSQPNLDADLPALQAHPLPEFLAKQSDSNNGGDYFSQIKSTPLGYLIWTRFPVKVYIEHSVTSNKDAASQRFQIWRTIVQQAIAQWQEYFPLEETANRSQADIIVLRSQPEREVKLDPQTGLFDIPRAIAAQTNYKFYLTEAPVKIAQKMTIDVSPNFTGTSLLATVRHELGHALGIWGHSPEPSDALYFSQVSDPPGISQRDLNTLRKIYQQPTRLGWKVKQ